MITTGYYVLCAPIQRQTPKATSNDLSHYIYRPLSLNAKGVQYATTRWVHKSLAAASSHIPKVTLYIYFAQRSRHHRILRSAPSQPTLAWGNDVPGGRTQKKNSAFSRTTTAIVMMMTTRTHCPPRGCCLLRHTLYRIKTWRATRVHDIDCMRFAVRRGVCGNKCRRVGIHGVGLGKHLKMLAQKWMMA